MGQGCSYHVAHSMVCQLSVTLVRQKMAEIQFGANLGGLKEPLIVVVTYKHHLANMNEQSVLGGDGGWRYYYWSKLFLKILTI